MRSKRELVWCILSGLPALGESAAVVSESTSSETSNSWPSGVGLLAGGVSRPRDFEREARGARKSECVGAGGAALLPLLEWAEGERVSSRLPFRSSGKREKVRRRAWCGLAAAAAAAVEAGAAAGASAGAEVEAEAEGEA
jgi:hypothetical protein